MSATFTNTLDDYYSFLARKHAVVDMTGFEVAPDRINHKLYPFQRDIVRWALRLGRSAMFEECGLGKTAQESEWARLVVEHTNDRVLMLAPLAVAYQTVEEAAKFDVEVKYCADSSQIGNSRIVITNYDRLDKFNPADFAGVVLDECFPKGTPIDCVDESNTVYQKHIENIQVGDAIINASGVDIVSDVHRREVKSAIKIRVAGKNIISSSNHPYFTNRGWVGASDLEPGDAIISVSEAMRMVRARLCGDMASGKPESILRSILFSEMAHESAGELSQSSQSRSSGETRQEAQRVVAFGESESIGGIGAYSQSQSDEQFQIKSKGIPHVETHEAQTFRAWGQWYGDDRSAIEATGGTWRGLDSGIHFITGKTDSRVSLALQTRLGERRTKSVYRSGWSLTQVEEASRHQKNREAKFFRVESLEVLELGHPELDQFRDEDGHVYFYDIGATQHPSFSIHGLLVHNSSILKSFTGSTKKKVVDAFRNTPYKLAGTATPAPNDYTELANHAEFLNVMGRDEMLARWFLHDSAKTQDYRLKKHAAADFWRWLTSWGVCLSKPGDLGPEYDMPAFTLPELLIHEHRVATSQATIDRVQSEGLLMPVGAPSSTELNKVKRESLAYRIERAGEIVAGIEAGRPISIWCNTNDESAALKALFPNALEVRGDTKDKEELLMAFTHGEADMIIVKPSIAGFGLNWQHCADQIHIGVSYSFEQTYQALRRSYRFGQTRPVNAHLIYAESEGNVMDALKQKQEAFQAMQQQMNTAMHKYGLFRDSGRAALKTSHGQTQMVIPQWLESKGA